MGVRTLLLSVGLGLITMASGAETVEIVRDEWGVPHIFAETEPGALFGQGYAMAEDRLGTMMKSYRKAIGRMAEYFGSDWVESDFIARVFRHEEVSREGFSQLPPEYQEACRAFVAGVKAFMEEHPERIPDWAIELEPWHLLAFGRYAIWGWPLGQAWGDFERREQARKDEQSDTGEGSNQWAVAARRTADGHVLLLIDPHLSWQDERLFFESHLHGGDLHVYGFNMTGAPYVGLGHNEFIAWAMTTGGPDTADVYEMTLNPQNPTQYQYDGEWRQGTLATIRIPVKTEEGTDWVSREVLYTHLGPVVSVEGEKGYAFRLAYADDVMLGVQIAKMNRARNLGEFLEALAIRSLMPQNVMYGDVYGNIYYQRTGRVPIRPEGYDWSRPVPGNTSATDWRGFHATADLVQILNPHTGWMQNCNISPGTMMADSPLTAERYPLYIYNDRTDRTNGRGRRANALLGELDRMTVEQAIEVALDTYIDGERPFREALLQAAEARPNETEDLSDALSLLREWDGHARQDRVGVTLFVEWKRRLDERRDRIPYDRIQSGEPLDAQAQEAMFQALRETVSYLLEKFGTIEVPWAQVFRARRGEESWPLDGIAGQVGLVTLRAISAHDPDEQGIMWARGGQLCPTVVQLKAGDVRSWSAVPYGQSEDPNSPHYTDQGRRLYAQRRLKDTWFDRRRLEGHVESVRRIEARW
ncbi:MAG: 7-beta-(4-carbaxybutanamido)cephalosporanic acid acylase [Candidatus Poribacteria bacterium]|nr:MAG: 7-beta-(4-carbaxybutanamido)cephalosporanic acid acylase [Candidatus Poribacteria bacterium]